jgi:hypothetical protein
LRREPLDLALFQVRQDKTNWTSAGCTHFPQHSGTYCFVYFIYATIIFSRKKLRIEIFGRADCKEFSDVINCVKSQSSRESAENLQKMVVLPLEQEKRNFCGNIHSFVGFSPLQFAFKRTGQRCRGPAMRGGYYHGGASTGRSLGLTDLSSGRRVGSDQSQA